MNDQKNKRTQESIPLLFTSFPHSSSPLLHIARLPKLLQNCAPNLSGNTVLTSWGDEQSRAEPQAHLLPQGLYYRKFRGTWDTELGWFPWLFFFFFQDSISCLCPINSLAETAREMARRCFHWFLGTINANTLLPSQIRQAPFSLPNEMPPISTVIQQHNRGGKWLDRKTTFTQS